MHPVRAGVQGCKLYIVWELAPLLTANTRHRDTLFGMDTRQVLTSLKAERARLDAAIAALEKLDSTGTIRRPGRPTGKTVVGAKPAKRKISPAARKKMSEAAKARWAQRKKADKKSL